MDGMKPVTLLCVVSVVLNIAGGVYVTRRTSATRSDAGADVVRATNRGEVKAGLSEETKRLLAETGTEDLAVLRDRLRAEGLPESIVRDVVSGRLWAERQAKLDAADPIKKRPWWQQTREQLPGDDVRMSRLGERLRFECLSRIDDLFPDYRDDSGGSSGGVLSVEKQRAVRKLRRDYEELISRVNTDAAGDPTSKDQEKLAYLGHEQEKDLRALLTPAEYEEQALRNAATEILMKKVAAIQNWSEREFMGMVAINQWYEQVYDNSVKNSDPFVQRSPEEQAMADRNQNERGRRQLELLGAEKLEFYEQMGLRPESYDPLARYIARYELPQSRMKELGELIGRWDPAYQAINQNTALSVAERRQAIFDLYRQMADPVSELMGPAIFDVQSPMLQMIRQSKEGSAMKGISGK